MKNLKVSLTKDWHCALGYSPLLIYRLSVLDTTNNMFMEYALEFKTGLVYYKCALDIMENKLIAARKSNEK